MNPGGHRSVAVVGDRLQDDLRLVVVPDDHLVHRVVLVHHVVRLQVELRVPDDPHWIGWQSPVVCLALGDPCLPDLCQHLDHFVTVLDPHLVHLVTVLDLHLVHGLKLDLWRDHDCPLMVDCRTLSDLDLDDRCQYLDHLVTVLDSHLDHLVTILVHGLKHDLWKDHDDSLMVGCRTLSDRDLDDLGQHLDHLVTILVHGLKLDLWKDHGDSSMVDVTDFHDPIVMGRSCADCPLDRWTDRPLNHVVADLDWLSDHDLDFVNHGCSFEVVPSDDDRDLVDRLTVRHRIVDFSADLCASAAGHPDPDDVMRMDPAYLLPIGLCVGRPCFREQMDHAPGLAGPYLHRVIGSRRVERPDLFVVRVDQVSSGHVSFDRVSFDWDQLGHDRLVYLCHLVGHSDG